MKKKMRSVIAATRCGISARCCWRKLEDKSMALKDKLPSMTESEKIDLLATDGMLVKRPLAYNNERVTVGFKEATYETTWKK